MINASEAAELSGPRGPGKHARFIKRMLDRVEESILREIEQGNRSAELACPLDRYQMADLRSVLHALGYGVRYTERLTLIVSW